MRVASFPPSIPQNPYQRLLYEHLRPYGVEVVERPSFKLRWLWRNRADVDVLHVHWPHPYYRHSRGPDALRKPLSYVKLGLFHVRLNAARALRYRIVWTVHELLPHETTSRRLDRLAASALVRRAHVLVAHDAWTRDAILRAYPSAVGRVAVVRHGSYIGVYPRGRPRSSVRADLGIDEDAFLFICFGHLRGYKNLDVLLDAFQDVSRPDTRLLIAGVPLDDDVGALIRRAAASDSRIEALIGFVPDEQVADLFEASDAAILPRGDGGTSGALILALSLGVPAVTAARPSYEELTGNGRAGWHFLPDDAASLRRVLEEVLADPAAAREKGEAARVIAERLSWDETAARTAELMRCRSSNHCSRGPEPWAWPVG